DPKPYTYSLHQLRALIDAKSLEALEAYGGVNGLIEALHTNAEYGLADVRPMPRTGTMRSVRSGKSTEVQDNAEQCTDLENRVRVYGANVLPVRNAKGLLQFIWLALQEKILIVLMVAAIVSLALGIYEDQVNDPSEADVHWIEGFAILVAIAIVVLVGSINDWQKDRQFRKLNAKKDDRLVNVIREGAQTQLSVHHLVVGDIMCMEPGDIVAADGIFLSGHNVKCDESSVTGETDAIRKRTLEECKAEIGHLDPLEHAADPFIISGSKVLEGVGRAVVVAVGENSFHGRIMLSLRQEAEDTPLQGKLNHLAEQIAKLGSASALLMLIILIILYFARWNSQSHEASAIASNLVGILITAVTVVVVAVPEGLPLAVTLALAFAMTRMLKDNNLVRVLAACETMGNATTVCSDKTGTLTQNRMSVVAGIVGRRRLFARVEESGVPGFPGAIDMSTLVNELPQTVTDLVQQAVAVNSNAFWDPTTEDFVGSKTETALLTWTRQQGAPEHTQLRDLYPVEQLWPFSSERKSMCTLVRITDPANGHVLHRAHVKGASEIILGRCTRILTTDGTTLASEEITEEVRQQLLHNIEQFASQSLRTIGIAYRDFPEYSKDSPLDDEHLSSELTLICIVGIEDPLREGVVDAVRLCQRAGVTVRMVTGDNIMTARAIATKCGIFTAGGIVMEGPKFRTLNDEQMREIIPRLQVLARSSPEDKRILVGKLKEMGDIVAVTGDGTNDGPALKMADIGFSMGIAGTEVAKEASAIILMDDNFASIVKAIMWGRSVNDAVKKFLQFQLTVNVTAVLLAFISAISSASSSNHVGSGESILTAVQLLWVNLIMDTLAALALATDPPTLELLNRQPEPRTAPLITFAMWKMILIQAIFQVAVCLVLLYAGPSIFDLPAQSKETPVLGTMVFNTFVWMQIFNEVNARRLDKGLNVFKGLLSNHFFLGIFVFIALCQAIIVQFGGYAFSTTPLTGVQWAVCLVIGLVSLPIGALVRLLPDSIFRCIGPLARLQDDQFRNPERDVLYEWKKDIRDVRTELSVFRALRGGRLRAYREAFPAAAMLPSIVASTVGVGVSMQSQPPVAKQAQ
ncbi:hypothetical protein THASP1DRAFT_20077, partial [Thamnocephalis sphaerospora]